MSGRAARALGDYGHLLDSLRGVTWPSRRAVLGGAAGTHRSKLRGQSPEFTEYRPYRQGDEARRLDWKLLARTDRAYLRITSDRATLGTVLVIDGSASMAFPADSLAKWRHACRLCVGLAAIANAAGDRVGLVVAGAALPLRVEPSTRRGVIGDIARVLSLAAPEAARAAADGWSLPRAVAALRGARRIAIVSDFLADEDALLGEARNLAAGGSEVFALHVVAVAELEPERRTVLATDPENPELRRPLAPEGIPDYRVAFDAWRAALARRWRDAGAVYTELTTDEPAVRALRRVTAVPGMRA